MCAWLGGLVSLTAWLVIRLRRLARQHRLPCGAALPDWFDDLLAAQARKLNLRRLPRVVLSPHVNAPAVFGLLRPVLLIPQTGFYKTSRRDAEHILLHELSHIKRGDLIVHAVYMILQIVYWFNPLLWLLRRHLQHLRELCCDATVAKLLREDTGAYRQTLLETARRLLAKPTEPTLGLLGLFENSNRLITRLNWLQKQTWKHPKLRLATITTATLLMLACVLPMAEAEKKPRDRTVKHDPNFSATLPNGVTVELIGVCEHPSQGKQWWRPDGAPLDVAPYHDIGAKVYHGLLREFAVRLSNLPDEQISYRWDLGASSAGGHHPDDDNGKQITDIWAVAAGLDESLDTAAVRFGVAAGPWTTQIIDQGKGSSVSQSGHGFSFAEPYVKDGFTYVTVSDNMLELTHRLIAVDTAGATHTPSNTDSGTAGGIRQSTFGFNNLPLDNIKEFQFQTRPYQWAQFKNVSLEPNYITDVQVQTDPSTTIPQRIAADVNTPAQRAAKRAAATFVPLGRDAGEQDHLDLDVRHSATPTLRWRDLAEARIAAAKPHITYAIRLIHAPPDITVDPDPGNDIGLKIAFGDDRADYLRGLRTLAAPHVTVVDGQDVTMNMHPIPGFGATNGSDAPGIDIHIRGNIQPDNQTINATTEFTLTLHKIMLWQGL